MEPINIGAIAGIAAAVVGALSLLYRLILGEWNLRRALARRRKRRVEIHIRQHYRTRFRFSLVSHDLTHWAINRLYLLYMAEFEWELGPVSIEALLFETAYGITLTRQYSEYDLLPLTPDREICAYEYTGSDSDHFSVELYGTDVSIIRICADYYDFQTKKQGHIESEDIKVERSSTMKPLWHSRMEVEPRRLLDDMSPLSLKVFTHENYQQFVTQLQPSQLKEVENDLRKLLNLASERGKPDQATRHQIEDYERLHRQYHANKDSLSEDEKKRLAELMALKLSGKLALEDAFKNRINDIITHIIQCR